MQETNFQPAVKCPYCGKTNRPAISGWGREGLNIRIKTCKYCEKDYSLVVYASTDKDLEIADGHISRLQSQIKTLKERIYEKRNNLVNEAAEWAEEFIRVEASSGGRQN